MLAERVADPAPDPGGLQAEIKHQFVHRSTVPGFGVGLTESAANSVTDVFQEPFQRHEAVAIAQEDAAAEACLVRPGEQPGAVVAVQGVGPERFLTAVQGGHLPEQQLRPLPVAHAMDGAQRYTQSGLIYFSSPFLALFPGLGLSDAVFRRLQPIAAGQGAPRACAVALEDDVGVHEDWTGMRRHRDSQRDGTLEPMFGEQVADAFDGAVEQRRGPAKRDEALVDCAGHDFGEAP